MTALRVRSGQHRCQPEQCRCHYRYRDAGPWVLRMLPNGGVALDTPTQGISRQRHEQERYQGSGSRPAIVPPQCCDGG